MKRMSLHAPVIGILRGLDAALFGTVMNASFAAGLPAIEITMNTEDAPAIVERYRSAVPPGSYLGVGTVRNIEEARTAVSAGAMFLVTPNLDRTVIDFAGHSGVPVIAGALSPTEVYTAWSAGADMVKVFPCRALGPGYIRDLRGPFDQIPLVAVGGVDGSNVADYLAAGAACVGVGTSLFGKKALSSGNGDELRENVRSFLDRCPATGTNTL